VLDNIYIIVVVVYKWSVAVPGFDFGRGRGRVDFFVGNKKISAIEVRPPHPVGSASDDLHYLYPYETY